MDKLYAFYITNVVWKPMSFRPSRMPMIAAYNREAVVKHIETYYEGNIISFTLTQGEEL